LVTLEELEKIVRENGKLEGWDFSQINTSYDPIPWDYTSIVRSYLRPTDKVLDIGTGGGEIFLSFASYLREGIGVDHNPTMIETAKRNQANLAYRNIEFVEMDGGSLQFEANEFDMVILRHLRVYVDEIARVLRPGGYFITQLVGKRSSKNILEAFGWTADSFGPDWWQSVGELVQPFQNGDCHIVALGEYDVKYWFKDIPSLMFWMMSVPWPEEIELEKHWQNINRILETSTSNRGIETNEHRGLLIAQKQGKMERGFRATQHRLQWTGLPPHEKKREIEQLVRGKAGYAIAPPRH
jgi:ubiquinone/menaquinone biosynthesis C-methylase UbiE